MSSLRVPSVEKMTLPATLAVIVAGIVRPTAVVSAPTMMALPLGQGREVPVRKAELRRL